MVAEQDSFSLGLVYFHPVADAESIVFLLKDMVDTYRGTGNPGRVNPVERYPARRDNLLRHYPGVLARKLASLPASIRSMRNTCRPHYRDAGDLSNKFTFFSLSPQTLSGMIQAAKSLNVTLNDLFLALLMKAVSPLAPDRAGTGRRRNLSLGCIVNTRRDLGVDGRRTFGLFLGSFVVHHEVPAGIGLADLARDIGRQTLAIKQRRLYLGSALELTFGRLMMALFSEQRRKKLYQKHYPLWGGLTNMNLNALWPQPEGSRPVDYFRAVSTGPVTPLVASITTIGPVANIGLTYRSTVFGAPDIERIKACFLDPLGPACPPVSPRALPLILLGSALLFSGCGKLSSPGPRPGARCARPSAPTCGGILRLSPETRAEDHGPGSGPCHRRRTSGKCSPHAPAPRIINIHGGVYPVSFRTW